MTTATSRRPVAIPRDALDQLMAILRHHQKYPGYAVADALVDAYRLGRAHGIAEDSRYGQYVPGPGGRPWSGIHENLAPGEQP